MPVSAKDWRGITPLRSTCEDVKQALKVDKCIFPMSEYKLPEYRVVVFFSENQSCDDPRDWHVPPGTVIGLTISPTSKMRPSELGIDIAKYQKLGDGDVVGMEHYESLKEGVTIELYYGYVQYLVFYPTSSDEKQRCKPLTRHPPGNC